SRARPGARPPPGRGALAVPPRRPRGRGGHARGGATARCATSRRAAGGGHGAARSVDRRARTSWPPPCLSSPDGRQMCARAPPCSHVSSMSASCATRLRSCAPWCVRGPRRWRARSRASGPRCPVRLDPQVTCAYAAPMPARPVAPATSRLALVRRARAVNRRLAEAYPDARCELDFTNPLELLVATVLSAQCTDVRVNLVTPELFARFPDAQSYASADPEEPEEIIRPTGFFRAKTRSIQGLARELVDKHDGQVPGRLEDLVALPGVGRK